MKWVVQNYPSSYQKLPASHQSNIVHQFLYHCDSCTKIIQASSITRFITNQFLCLSDSQYVGCTSQRVQQRIKQHVLGTILQGHISQDRSTLARFCKPIRSLKTKTSFSAIAQHLLQNPSCAHEYNENKIFHFCPWPYFFHLSTLEATYIKTSKPKLCKQKGIRVWPKNLTYIPLLLLVAPFCQSRRSFLPFS